MESNVKLEHLAIHYVDIKSKQVRYATDEQEIATLNPAIMSFFLDLLAKVWDASEKGTTSSARFAGKPAIQQCLNDILAGTTDFFQTSKTPAHQLYQKTPNNASPGLLAIIRFTTQTSKGYVALLKIRHKDEDFVRALGSALTKLQVEHVQNMLLKEIQKGAISPHPTRSEYDLKIIDEQAADEPALYFREFLGCKAKQSDAHQTKTLLSLVQEYGEFRKLPTKRERLPRVIRALRELERDVTTDSVAEAIQETRVLGSNFDARDFKKYVNEQSDIGTIDIPIEVFIRSGKKAVRKYSIVFNDPKYQGLTISGPPEIIEKIVSVEGEKIIFRIQTTKEGYKQEYE